MSLSERTRSRLSNWKFGTAYEYMILDRDFNSIIPSENEHDTIKALSNSFGNSGWFDGSLGDVVRAAVWYLGVEE